MPKLIADLNCHLRGWANYFAFGYPAPAFRQMDWYLLQRLRQLLPESRMRQIRTFGSMRGRPVVP